MISDFESVRVLLSILMLAGASFFDLKFRSVNDIYWIIFLAAGSAIYIFDFQLYADNIEVWLSISLTLLFSFLSYRMGLFGGADLLAIVSLAVILPVYHGLFSPLNTLHNMAPIITISNALVTLALIQVIINLAKNIAYFIKNRGKLFDGFNESTSRKVAALFIGHKSAKADTRYAILIEKNIGNVKKFDFSIKPAETVEFIPTSENTWVTLGLPFIFYIAIGFFIMIFFGDIVSILYSSVAK